jgi:hypothetical protein
MAKVRNSERPVMTVFGGNDAVPIAVRVIPKTTAIRVKHVMHRIMAGANDNNVSNARILMLLETDPLLANSLPPTEIDMSGNPALSACANGTATSSATNRLTIK